MTPVAKDSLDRRAPVWSVLVLAFALLAWGEIRATDPYSSAAFVVGYVRTEIQVTTLLVIATALFWTTNQLGLRRPHIAPLGHIAPLVLLTIVAVAVRMWVATQVEPQMAPDPRTGWLLLRTTLMVGINEEWLFRGLVLAAFCRWWGWRRGWRGALLAFASVHLLNLITGVPPWAAAFQFCNTFLMGAVFLLAAVSTRSLLWPMLAHAIYDWAVTDAARHVAAGAPPTGTAVLALLALALGIFSLWTLWKLPERTPYAT